MDGAFTDGIESVAPPARGRCWYAAWGAMPSLNASPNRMDASSPTPSYDVPGLRAGREMSGDGAGGPFWNNDASWFLTGDVLLPVECVDMSCDVLPLPPPRFVS